MLQEPMMEKLTAMRLLGMVDALQAQEQDPASRELSFLEGSPVGRSAVDLARKSSPGAALACRQAERRVRRGDRLPCCTRIGQKRDPRAGAEVGLGDQSRKHLRARAHRRGQELRGLRAGAEGLPRWLLGAVHARRGAVPRSGHRARRRQSAQLLARLSRIDVLVIDDWAMAPLSRSRAPRLLGDLRGSLPDALDHPYLTTAGHALARTDRRSHSRRWHPRPAGSQRPSHRDARRFDAQETWSAAVELTLAGVSVRWGGDKGCRPFPRTPFSASGTPSCAALRTAPDRFSLTKPNTSCTIEVPASLRSENCSPSARNAVRVPSGISVRLRRNPQPGTFSCLPPSPRTASRPSRCATVRSMSCKEGSALSIS
jgi:hypothetical protein